MIAQLLYPLLIYQFVNTASFLMQGRSGHVVSKFYYSISYQFTNFNVAWEDIFFNRFFFTMIQNIQMPLESQRGKQL